MEGSVLGSSISPRQLSWCPRKWRSSDQTDDSSSLVLRTPGILQAQGSEPSTAVHPHLAPQHTRGPAPMPHLTKTPDAKTKQKTFRLCHSSPWALAGSLSPGRGAHRRPQSAEVVLPRTDRKACTVNSRKVLSCGNHTEDLDPY